jgi:hypothetical protein
MSASQRLKGQRGERELHALLSDQLGTVVRRNIDQARQGGADGLEVPGWSIEIKRCEKTTKGIWWAQTLRQANGRKPILFYRASRRPWMAVVRITDLAPQLGKHDDWETAEISLEAACCLIRETLP